MKRLLHSKLFRKNLYNWLLMYIAVIGLFTSVVTYSKYISNFQGDSSAKVALFDAAITYDGVCSGKKEDERCDVGTFRPVSNISYYFTVDTTNLEVSTIFVTRISIMEHFNNVRIYDVTDEQNEIELTNFTNNNNIYTLTEDIEIDATYVRKYKITMDFDYQNKDHDHSEAHPLTDAVKVGYSAIQKD